MAKWTKNHSLEMGLVLGIVGLILTIISFTYKFVQPNPSFLTSYANLVQRPEGDYNLILFIGGPILLIIGGFYFGEQLVLRRRFDRMIDTPKKSEFASRRRDLEDLAKRLPDAYNKKIKAKDAEFNTTTSRRAA